MSGAFDCLEINRNKLFNSIDLMLNYSQAIEKEKISNQQNLFNQIIIIIYLLICLKFIIGEKKKN